VIPYRPGRGPKLILASEQALEIEYSAAFDTFTHKHWSTYMNKDQVKGQYKQAKGNVKEATGKVLGDKTMEGKGKIQNAAGKIQEAYGDVKKGIKDKFKK
jgi:uncharacterized protein YjbJ (UPF0337 family)